MNTPKVTDNNATPRLALSLDEAAKSIGLSRRTTWTLISSGQMPGCKIGGKWVVPVAALEQWLSAQAAAHTTAITP